ncbi:hypothetical protein SD71_05020 [Cohnella kolymensis]|uniref:Uncharacterized protein n=1 Tax=Cohnella kolymensis TaxID=1590652 RepID=A0ABR5A7Q5_9BACL|nr:hypothetical protein [Cohnella kolymensis]KIL37026.1 hypothetical protein SD71_05020 [Cohnella kolymensis]
MTGEHMILHLLLWITALGFLTFFDFAAKKRLGVKSQGYLNLRLPKSIALILASVTAIISLYLLQKDLIQPNSSSYLAIPYFAAISYFIVSFFREIKDVSASKDVRR